MNDKLSNFGILMDILEVTPGELTVAIGADKTLVSRWRSGERRLVSGRKWVKSVSEYFAEVDAASCEPLLTGLLSLFYSPSSITEEGVTNVLRKWLSVEGQNTPDYRGKRRELLLSFFSRSEKRAGNQTRKTVVGRDAVKDTILDFLAQVAEMPGSGEMIFVCPEGLALVTKDECYATMLMENLSKLFKSGKHLTVVLRTDFKMSEVSAFSGPWLSAHLSGNIKSLYYDDFRMIESDKMLFTYEKRIAGVVSPCGDNDVKFTVFTEQADIDIIDGRCRSHQMNSEQRFHYQFFGNPNGFLMDFSKQGEMPPCYLFQKLPIFGLCSASALFSNAGLSLQDIENIENEFKPFFLTPETLPEKTRINHLLCSDVIDEMLDGGKQRSCALSEMAGRPVSITPQMIVERLNMISAFIRMNKNYSVCFMPSYFYEKLGIQIGVWGNSAAIGWVSGEHSAACRDYINTSSLHGYCATVWEGLPSSVRSRAATLKRINAWIKRAQRFGLKID